MRGAKTRSKPQYEEEQENGEDQDQDQEQGKEEYDDNDQGGDDSILNSDHNNFLNQVREFLQKQMQAILTWDTYYPITLRETYLVNIFFRNAKRVI